MTHSRTQRQFQEQRNKQADRSRTERPRATPDLPCPPLEPANIHFYATVKSVWVVGFPELFCQKCGWCSLCYIVESEKGFNPCWICKGEITPSCYSWLVPKQIWESTKAEFGNWDVWKSLFAKKQLTKVMELNRALCWFLPVSCRADLPVEQPKPNVWAALAKAAGSDTISLSNSNPEKPFSICLVGVPAKYWPIPICDDPSTEKQFNTKPGEVANGSNPMSDWDIWTKELPKAISQP